ncbi:MAG: aromatic amino acid lyase [Rhodothermales bacterium]|nr:aromatic amino acid lyase [Rhodothermales bacterium]
MTHATNALFPDGDCLTCESLAEAIKQKERVELTGEAWQRVSAAREMVERITSADIAAYGINAGVGSQKDYAVPSASLLEFNRRLVSAHATWVPGKFLTDNVVRGALIVLLNGFAKGNSGVSKELIQHIISRLADDQFPQIDAGGTVGASEHNSSCTDCRLASLLGKSLKIGLTESQGDTVSDQQQCGESDCRRNAAC